MPGESILVLGAGLQGRAVIEDLCRRLHVGKVLVADMDRDKARAEAETTSYTIARTRADIVVDVHNAVAAMDEAASRVNLTTYNVERAETLVKIANDSYLVGGATSLEVIDARLMATRARLAHLKACYDYRVARVRLAAAQGDIEGMWR